MWHMLVRSKETLKTQVQQIPRPTTLSTADIEHPRERPHEAEIQTIKEDTAMTNWMAEKSLGCITVKTCWECPLYCLPDIHPLRLLGKKFFAWRYLIGDCITKPLKEDVW